MATQPALIRRHRLPIAIATVGIVALGVGIALVVWAALHPATFGWTAYAPLSEAALVPGTSHDVREWGERVIALGLVFLAFSAGLLIGRRRS
jgi:heme/copper-type cytochrome/quinol oxidase subunit 1